MDAHASSGFPQLQLVSMMSVPPFKVTEPRTLRPVLCCDPISKEKSIHGCYQICLCYEKLSGVEEEHDDDDDGKYLTGWLVESLAKVLSEHPLLAGRLHRGRDDDFEIVSNDSGIRLLEAVYPITLSEFLVLNQKENLEAELVFWNNIDDQFPEYSPLFYVQVTKFKCGGYSIGISCSLLLAEVLVAENFLKKWAEMHKNMMLLLQKEGNKVPIFGHPPKKDHAPLPSDMISRTLTTNERESFVFKITTTDDVDYNRGLLKELAMLCVEDTEKKLHREMGSEFSLLVNVSTEAIRIESCSNGGCTVRGKKLKNQITCAAWKDFGEYEVAFEEGNKAVHVSWWIGSVAYGHVMALPYPNENVSAVVIVVSPPIEAQL